jgi:AraC family ethanolamine operon transcriptional activator
MASLTVSIEPGLARRMGAPSALASRPSFPSPADFVEHQLSSAEELQQVAGGADYCQLAPGRFRVRLTRLRTPRLELCLETWSLGMLKRGNAPRQKVTLICSIGRGRSGRLQGRPVVPGEVLVLFEGEPFDCRSLEPAHLATVSLERFALESRAREIFGRGLHELRLDGRLQWSRVDPAVLRGVCHEAFARVAAEPQVLRRPSFGRDLEAFIVSLLLREGPASAAAPADPPPVGRSRALALRAEAWLRECLADPPTMADLCAAVGAGERTIHEAFREHLGTTPMAYQKALRLNAARQALVQAGTRTKVTDVALDWGFLHFGWFSQDYRRLFGETPSQTLHRGRGEYA